MQNSSLNECKTLFFRYDFSISAENNSRRHNGTTVSESNDSHVQLIKVNKITWKGLYKVNFTDDEIISNGTFCNGVKDIKRMYSNCYMFLIKINFIILYDHFSDEQFLGFIPPDAIEQTVLKSLTGW